MTGLLAVSLLFASLSEAYAQDGIIGPGDAVVTGFSGISPTGEPVPPAGSPLDTFFIDVEGPSAQVLSFGALGGPPQGQLVTPAPKLILKAKQIGQVFAIGFDDGLGAATPSFYLGATSAYGIHIVRPDPANPGKFLRLKKGHAEAQWMSGMFAGEAGGNPGSIFKVDGTTGTASLFATLPGNSGPGVGDVVFDKAGKHFYVSDLDTGLIHRIDSSGVLVDTFDHGVAGRPAKGLAAIADDGKVMDITNAAFDTENPNTWGYTQKDRMVYGMAVHEGRLYYAVAGGHQIWSIGLGEDGSFAGDPRWELDASGLPGNGPITDMLFDKDGRMYLAQRGTAKGSYSYAEFAEPGKSTVQRYRLEQPDDPATESRWVSDPESYAIAMPAPHNNSNGGIALGFAHDEFGSIKSGTRDSMLWTTGEKLRTSSEDDADPAAEIDVHGLQGNDVALVRPDNEPPQKSYFADYDGLFNDPEKAGHLGDVEIWQPAGDFAQLPPGDGYFPPLAEPPGGILPPPPPLPPEPGYELNLELKKYANPQQCFSLGQFWRCHYRVSVRNTSNEHWYVGQIQVKDQLLDLPAGSFIGVPEHPAPWFCSFLVAPHTFQCERNAALPPLTSVNFHVHVTIPKTADKCHLTNVAEITHPIGGSWNNIDPVDDIDDATAIIPDPDCNPEVEETNLNLKKDAHPDPCLLLGTGDYYCRYRVTVRNVGGGIFKHKLSVQDNPPAGTTAVFGGNFTCGPNGPGHKCTHNIDPLTLGLAQPTFLWVGLVVPVDVAKANDCKITNAAHILEPPGGAHPMNTVLADDADTAVAHIPAHVCEPPPTNLKVEKEISGGVCPVVGDQVKCTWQIKVSNTTANKYKDVVELNETLPGAPTSMASNAPWSCVLAGGGGGAICKHPFVEIPGFGHINLDLETTFPIELAKELECKLVNLVEIAKAPGGTPMNTNPADDTAQAAGFVDLNICQPPPVPVECPPGFRPEGNQCLPKGTKPPVLPPPTDVSCPQDMRPVSRNRLVSLRQSGWRIIRIAKGRWCGEPGRIVDPKPEVCPKGTRELTYARASRLRRAGWTVFRLSSGKWCGRPGKDCKPGQIRRAGRCIWPPCPKGYTGRQPNCTPIVKPCPRGTVKRGDKCVPIVRPCPQGTKRVGRRCVPIVKPCPKGTKRVGRRCIPIVKPCPKGTKRVGRRCVPVVRPCPKGTKRVGRRCVRVSRPQVRPRPNRGCGRNQYRAANGRCVTLR
ncbi:MAG: hypothetical protein ACR2OV_10035 [Hyphomicrobiaceae bacterium]